MFLLYVDQSDGDLDAIRARQSRALLKDAFDDISDTAIVNDIEDISRLIEEYPAPHSCLTVPFGEKATERAAKRFFCTPVLNERKTDLLRSPKILAAFVVGGPEGFRKDEMAMVPVSGGAPKAMPPIAWPFWHDPAVKSCRLSSPSAHKPIHLPDTDILHDTAVGGETAGTGTIFAASPNSVNALTSLIDVFVNDFRHSPEAILLLYTDGSSSDAAKASKQRLSTLSDHACRIIVLGTSGNDGTFLHPASFYIKGDDDQDDLTGYRHFCAQVPLITREAFGAKVGLPNDYAMTISEEGGLSAKLKDAFHIAQTAPEGYHHLRRTTADNARDHFSITRTVQTIRSVIGSREFSETLPHTDDRRLREEHFGTMVGIYDYKESGWLDHENQSVAPGFPITNGDIVVDVGCGTGGYSYFSAQFAGEIVYCDVDSTSLKVASERIGSVATCPIRGLLTTGEQLDINEGYADKVICTEVLEHVDNPKQVMQELFRIGKPGGLYLISVPDTLGERLQEPVAPPGYFEKPNHIRIFEREEFARLVTDAGFEIVDHQFRGFHAVVEWLLKWFDSHTIDHQWAALWKNVLDHRQGAKTKAVLDRYIAKSQTIIARKPG